MNFTPVNLTARTTEEYPPPPVLELECFKNSVVHTGNTQVCHVLPVIQVIHRCVTGNTGNAQVIHRSVTSNTGNTQECYR